MIAVRFWFTHLLAPQWVGRSFFLTLFTFLYISHNIDWRNRNRGVGGGRGHGNKCLGFSTAKPVIQFTTTNSIGNPLTIFNEIVLSFDDKEAGLLNENNTL